jgi:quinolinate synthase
MLVQDSQLKEKIMKLKKEKDVVILAHNYQIPEVQDVADFTGDSLGLSRQAATVPQKTILFCGVNFMAETAAIISPDKKVLLPDFEAGCSLSDSITVDELRNWKKQHPGAIAVGYVNTTAEIKAELDYCCTSSNAVNVVNAIPADKEILFLPDMFLGSYVAKMTGRKNIHIWAGECHVHAGITPEDVTKKLESMNDAELVIHPECSCTTPFMYDVADGSFDDKKVSILSTEGMMNHVTKSKSKNFVVATETGILYKMKQQNPDKTFVAASEKAECQYMKMINLEKVYDTLINQTNVVTVPKEIADKARLAIDRMLAIS